MIIERRASCDLTHFSDATPKILQQIYASRGVHNESELSLTLNHIAHFNQLKGIEQGVALLQDAFEQRQRIMIVGDFDADGATSTALLVLALRDFGYPFVDYLVPDRFDDGYGLTPTIIDQIIPRGVDLLITVDNGISSIEGVAYAKTCGLKVLITDHHLAGAQLPNADAIVNPNLKECHFPSKALAGVGVAFYLIAALRHARRALNSQLPQPNIANYLDLVALGTIADVVPLDYNNRILVHQGLQRIRSGLCRPGILALLQVAKKQYQEISSQDLGFALGPRLNAAGRLDKMNFGVALLLNDDLQQSLIMAQELDNLNKMRKEIEMGMKQEALVHCHLSIKNDEKLPDAFILYQDNWHQGVIGIIASRIKDDFHRPTIAFARDNSLLSENKTQLKGSGRSIKGFHLRDALDRINATHPEIIIQFGGHAMAAGLTINENKLEQFRKLFEQDVNTYIDSQFLTNKIISDGILTENELTLTIAKLIKNGGPWGQQFPLPLFDGQFKILQQRLIAQKHLKLTLTPSESYKKDPNTQAVVIDAILFNADLTLWPDASITQIHIAYQLDINHYKEKDSLQLLIQAIKPIQISN